MPRETIMALNAVKLHNLKPKDADYRVADGGGLYVLVKTTGAKLFRYDYRLAGSRRTLALGEFGDGAGQIGLATARQRHGAAVEAVGRGEHPVSPAREKAAAQAAAKLQALADAAAVAEAEEVAAKRTFGLLAEEWLAARKVGKSEKTYARDARSVRYLKAGYRGARGFGGLDVRLVEAGHLSAIGEKLNKPTRIRVVLAAKKIMGVAKRKGWITVSPFSDIDFHEGLPAHREKKRPAITDEAKFGELLRQIDAYNGRGNNLTWYGLKLLALTFVRPDTMAKAAWKHFDLDGARWVIPFDALKMEWLSSENGEAPDDFTVPLSRQAVALLRELHKITGKGRYLFPACGVGNHPGEVMSENTLNYALHGLGYKGIHCAHGFRASASTILNRQRTGERRRMFEIALVEIQQDRLDASTRAIYDRDDLMPERIGLMQYWADLVDTLRDGGRSNAKRQPSLKAVA
jgi:integrase